MANILHMDTDSTREFSRQMAQTIEIMRGQVDEMRGRIETMDWISLGRDQFVNEFDQNQSAFLSLLQDGETLSQRVSKEADEWEAAAPLTGGGVIGMPTLQSGSGQGFAGGGGGGGSSGWW
jgi:hypothetical protein